MVSDPLELELWVILSGLMQVLRRVLWRMQVSHLSSPNKDFLQLVLAKWLRSGETHFLTHFICVSLYSPFSTAIDDHILLYSLKSLVFLVLGMEE